jgi:hypothetical protein
MVQRAGFCYYLQLKAIRDIEGIGNRLIPTLPYRHGHEEEIISMLPFVLAEI